MRGRNRLQRNGKLTVNNVTDDLVFKTWLLVQLKATAKVGNAACGMNKCIKIHQASQH